MTKWILPLLLWGMGMGGATREFSHYRHVKQEELVCSDCHSKTMRSSRVENITPVSFNTCMKCHADDSGFDRELPLVMTDSSFHIAKKAEPGTLKFSHKAHLDAKVDCSVCHGQLVGKEGDSTRIPVPEKDRLSMKSCMECHLKKAEVSCLTCHNEIMKPLDHFSGIWIKSQGHGLQANLRDQDCALCHDQQTTCTECHMGLDSKKVHGLNYRYNHGVDVRFKKLDCAACHQPLEQFCGDCHEGKGRPAR